MAFKDSLTKEMRRSSNHIKEHGSFKTKKEVVIIKHQKTGNDWEDLINDYTLGKGNG